MLLNSINLSEFITLFPTTGNDILANKFKVKEGTIRSWAALYKLHKKNGFYWKKSEEKYLLKYKSLLTYLEISVKLNRTRWAVINKYRAMNGYPFNTKKPKLTL